MSSQEATAVYHDRKHFTLLLTICVMALIVRLGALWVAPEIPLDDGARAHLSGAHMLNNGAGFADPSFPVIVAPLYTVFLAFSSFLFSNEQLAVKIAQAVLDTMTTFLIYLIAREVFGGKTALFSAFIWALYPFSIYANLYIGSETLVTFLLSCFVLLMLYAVKSSDWKLYCGAGVLLGLATLTRGTTQFFPVIFLLVLFVMLRHRQYWLTGYVTFLLSFVLVLVPWSLRNLLVLDEYIPTTTSGSMVLLWGSSEEFFTIDERVRSLPSYIALLDQMGIREVPGTPAPIRSSEFLRKAAIEKYRLRLHEDPTSFMPFLLKKCARLWYATESGRNHQIIGVLNAPIYLLALLGLKGAWGLRRQSAWLLVGVVGYFIAIHVITLPLFRYMVPVMPYIIIFAGFALATIPRRSSVS